MRDLKADLEEWHSDLIHGTRSTDWFYLVGEYIERAVKAEEEFEKEKKYCVEMAEAHLKIINNNVQAKKKAYEEAAALREENEELKKALGLIIDDMGEDSCPYEYDYVDKPECENCPHDHEIHVDTERDVRCWKEYYLAKAGEDL